MKMLSKFNIKKALEYKKEYNEWFRSLQILLMILMFMIILAIFTIILFGTFSDHILSLIFFALVIFGTAYDLNTTDETKRRT